MAFYEPVIRALNEAQVRYVVVGGLAVVLHGYARFTVDLDLAVDLSPPEAAKVIDAMQALDLHPTAPIDPQGFADAATREAWSRDKHMEVFSLSDPADPLRQVDLFIRDPIPFEELWARSTLVSLGGATSARIAAIPDRMGDPVSDGWERHHREQLLRWASTTPARRLAWLEEARELVRHVLTAQRSPRGGVGP